MAESIECFKGIHILHVFITAIVSIVFLIICLIVSLVFFENSQISDKHDAKINSRIDFAILLIKVLKSILFSFLTKKALWFLIICLCVLSTCQIILLYRTRPYYNKIIQIYVSCLNSIYCWSTYVLLFQKVLDSMGYSLKSGIFLFFAGIPLICLFLAFSYNDDTKIISEQLTDESSVAQIENYIRKFCLMIDEKLKGNRIANFQLKGFIYQHEEDCTNSQCPLKEYKFNLENSINNDKFNFKVKTHNYFFNSDDIKNKQNANEDLYYGDSQTQMLKKNDNALSTHNILKQSDLQNSEEHVKDEDNDFFNDSGDSNLFSEKQDKNEKYVQIKEIKLFFNFIDRIFAREVAKRKRSTSLIISYAMFLYERLKQKELAFMMFQLAENYSPPFDEEFIIFRYKKIITEEDEKSTNNTANNLDLVSEIAYDSHYKQFVKGIELSCQLYEDFWYKILNESFDNFNETEKLSTLAKKINENNIKIKIHWESMNKLKSNDPKALINYYLYSTNVLNDSEQGNYYLNIWQDLLDSVHIKIGFLNIDVLENFVNEVRNGAGLILCKGDQNDLLTFGEIIHSSAYIKRLFGYDSKEILGKPFMKLLIDIYSDSIKHLVINYLNITRNLKKSEENNDKFLDSNAQTPNINYKNSNNNIQGINQTNDLDNSPNTNLLAKNKYASPQVNLINYESSNSNQATDALMNIGGILKKNNNLDPLLMKLAIEKGILCFGKTKNDRTIAFKLKIYYNKILDKYNDTFCLLFYEEREIKDIKNDKKTAYFLVDSNLKIYSTNITSYSSEFLKKINRKIEYFIDLREIFPEISKPMMLPQQRNSVFRNNNITNSGVSKKRRLTSVISNADSKKLQYLNSVIDAKKNQNKNNTTKEGEDSGDNKSKFNNNPYNPNDNYNSNNKDFSKDKILEITEIANESDYEDEKKKTQKLERSTKKKSTSKVNNIVSNQNLLKFNLQKNSVQSKSKATENLFNHKNKASKPMNKYLNKLEYFGNPINSIYKDNKRSNNLNNINSIGQPNILKIINSTQLKFNQSIVLEIEVQSRFKQVIHKIQMRKKEKESLKLEAERKSVNTEYSNSKDNETYSPESKQSYFSPNHNNNRIRNFKNTKSPNLNITPNSNLAGFINNSNTHFKMLDKKKFICCSVNIKELDFLVDFSSLKNNFFYQNSSDERVLDKMASFKEEIVNSSTIRKNSLLGRTVMHSKNNLQALRNNIGNLGNNNNNVKSNVSTSNVNNINAIHKNQKTSTKKLPINPLTLQQKNLNYLNENHDMRYFVFSVEYKVSKLNTALINQSTCEVLKIKSSKALVMDLTKFKIQRNLIKLKKKHHMALLDKNTSVNKVNLIELISIINNDKEEIASQTLQRNYINSLKIIDTPSSSSASDSDYTDSDDSDSSSNSEASSNEDKSSSKFSEKTNSIKKNKINSKYSKSSVNKHIENNFIKKETVNSPNKANKSEELINAILNKQKTKKISSNQLTKKIYNSTTELDRIDEDDDSKCSIKERSFRKNKTKITHVTKNSKNSKDKAKLYKKRTGTNLNSIININSTYRNNHNRFNSQSSGEDDDSSILELNELLDSEKKKTYKSFAYLKHKINSLYKTSIADNTINTSQNISNNISQNQNNETMVLNEEQEDIIYKDNVLNYIQSVTNNDLFSKENNSKNNPYKEYKENIDNKLDYSNSKVRKIGFSLKNLATENINSTNVNKKKLTTFTTIKMSNNNDILNNMKNISNRKEKKELSQKYKSSEVPDKSNGKIKYTRRKKSNTIRYSKKLKNSISKDIQDIMDRETNVIKSDDTFTYGKSVIDEETLNNTTNNKKLFNEKMKLQNLERKDNKDNKDYKNNKDNNRIDKNNKDYNIPRAPITPNGKIVMKKVYFDNEITSKHSQEKTNTLQSLTKINAFNKPVIQEEAELKNQIETIAILNHLEGDINSSKDLFKLIMNIKNYSLAVAGSFVYSFNKKQLWEEIVIENNKSTIAATIEHQSISLINYVKVENEEDVYLLGSRLSTVIIFKVLGFDTSESNINTNKFKKQNDKSNLNSYNKNNYNSNNYTQTKKINTHVNNVHMLNMISLIVFFVFVVLIIVEYIFVDNDLQNFHTINQFQQFYYNSIIKFQSLAYLVQNVFSLNEYIRYQKYIGTNTDKIITDKHIIDYYDNQKLQVKSLVEDMNIKNYMELINNSLSIIESHYGNTTDFGNAFNMLAKNDAVYSTQDFKDYLAYKAYLDSQGDFTVQSLNTLESFYTFENATIFYGYEAQLSYITPFFSETLETINNTSYDNDQYVKYYFNNFNGFMIQAYTSYFYIDEVIRSIYDVKRTEKVSFLIVSIIVFLLSSIVLYKNVIRVEIERQTILDSFHLIPNYFIHWLSDRCSRFSYKLISLNNIDNQNRMNINNEEDDDIDSFSLKEIKKNYSHLVQNKKNYLSNKANTHGSINKMLLTSENKVKKFSFKFKFLIFSLLVLLLVYTISSYFIIYFIFKYDFINLMRAKSSYGIHATAIIISINYARNLFFDLDGVTSYFNLSKNSDAVFDYITKNMIGSKADFDNYVYNMTYLFNNDVLDYYRGTSYSSLCDLEITDAAYAFNIDLIKKDYVCSDVLEYGYNMAFDKYYVFLDSLSKIYSSGKRESIENFYSESYYYQGNLSYNYLKTINKNLIGKIHNRVESYISSIQNFKIIFAIVIITLLFLNFVFYWMPFEYQLNDDIVKTRQMLSNVIYEFLNRYD